MALLQAVSLFFSRPHQAPMKIHQLPDGARFEYEGAEYVKTGPMFATGNGGQRLIPRYAVLNPLGGIEQVSEKTKDDFLSRADVRKAFDELYAECKCLVPEGSQAALNDSRARFLDALG
jgi:hypothetical protein